MKVDKFSVQLTQSAVDDLNAISYDRRRRIFPDIRTLSSNPFPFGPNIKKLKGFRPPLYRLRSGEVRILYRVQGRVVTILRIIDRKELERVIRRLKL